MPRHFEGHHLIKIIFLKALILRASTPISLQFCAMTIKRFWSWFWFWFWFKYISMFNHFLVEHWNVWYWNVCISLVIFSVTFLNNLPITVVTLSYDVSLLWNAARIMPSVQLISHMHCNASLRWGSQYLLFITITIINDHIISQLHKFLHCTNMLLKIIVFKGKVLTWPLEILKVSSSPLR